MLKLIAFALAGIATLGFSPEASASLESGRAAIHKMAGCYLIDYNYAETVALKAGYSPDPRIYDVNKDKSVKELIYAIETSPSEIRLQHILFATDLNGNYMQGSELRHQAEDWQFEAPYLYDFVSPAKWTVRDLRDLRGQWTRRITNLDDGLRYQCSAPWSTDKANAEWQCANYSPIPGRETRDMGRKDYNTLARDTRIVVYGTSWLERQNNIKTIHAADGAREQLVKEEGKNWYVRLPDSECDPVRGFVKERSAFWNLLQTTWNEVLNGSEPFNEKVMQPPRYARMMQIEANFLGKDLNDAAIRGSAKQQIMQVIEDYRAR